VPNVNPFDPDDTTQPTPQPDAPPVDPSANGVSYVDQLRAFLHNQIDTFANNPDAGIPAWAAPAFNAEKAVGSYVPGPAGDAYVSGMDTLTNKNALVDALHAGVDTALDPATRARAASSVGRGVQQGLSGFNNGLGNLIFAAPDALDSATGYVAGKIANVIGAAPPPTLPSAHDAYNQTFVAPGGAPNTPMEKRIRGTAQSFATDLPALLVGGGAGAAGVRSGVTMAEQAAPGLLDTISAPVAGIAGKLRGMIPNFINGLRPTNIANAVRASNLQGAADTTLQQVAARPQLASYAALSRDWRSVKRRQAQEDAQQAQPSN
jgi:hypothetical protein